MKEVKPKEDVKKVSGETLTDEQKAQGFIKEYSELCEKHGYQIVVSPAWKARDDGTFSLIQQRSIGKLPKVDSK